MVIAIIAILIGLLLPAVQKVREAADRSTCQNNLKQIGLGLHAYHDSLKTLPPGGVSGTVAQQAASNAGFSFHVLILPYIEQGPIFQLFDRTRNPYDAVNRPRSADRVPIFYCPSFGTVNSAGSAADEGANALTAHYYGVAGPTGPKVGTTGNYPENASGQGVKSLAGSLYQDSKVRLSDIKDGTSNTLMVGEISWDWTANPSPPTPISPYRTWTRGCTDPNAPGTSGSTCVSARTMTLASAPFKTTAFTAGNFNNVSFGSEHPGGANFAVGDGTVRFIRASIAADALRAAASRADQEILTLD